MIITEQRIKQIILEELLLEQKIVLKENLFKELIDKFLNKPKNVPIDEYAKNLEKNYSIDSDTMKQTQDAYKEINSLINQGVDPKEAKRYIIGKEIEKIKKLSGFSDNDQETRDTSSVKPPPPPEDDENSEKIGAKDIVPDEESTRSASKFSKLAQQVAGDNKDKQKQIEALLTFLEKGGHLKPEALKKLGLSESIIKQFISLKEGNKNMKLTETLVKQLIKEEMQKNKTNKVSEGVMSGLAAVGKLAANTYKSGNVQGNVKNSLTDIASNSKSLSDKIYKLINTAKSSNLVASKELDAVMKNLSALNKSSNDLSVKKDAELLVQKGSPEAASDSAGDASATQTPAGGSIKAFGKQFSGTGPEGGLGGVAATDASTQGSPTSTGASKQVPIFKATPDSKGDVLSMKLKSLFSKAPNPDQLLTQYLKLVSNQLKANGIKLMEAKGDNLSAQLGGFTSKTAQTPGTAASIQQGSIDLFGPAVLLLKKAGMDQKEAVTLANQIKDLTAKHLQKYNVNLPQKASRVAKPATPATTPPATPTPAAPATPTPAAPATPATPTPAAPATPTPAAPATPATPAPAAGTGAEAPAAAEPAGKPAEASASATPEEETGAEAKQSAPRKKKLSEMPTGESAGKVLTDFFKQFQDDEEFKTLNINVNNAKESVTKIATALGIKASDLLAENKLNEHLISRNKKSNNSLTSEQVERMKLLAGINK